MHARQFPEAQRALESNAEILPSTVTTCTGLVNMARRPCTFKQGDITRALRGAKAAGIEIQRLEIDTAGKIVLVTASHSLQSTPSELDRELAEFEVRHGQD